MLCTWVQSENAKSRCLKNNYCTSGKRITCRKTPGQSSQSLGLSPDFLRVFLNNFSFYLSIVFPRVGWNWARMESKHFTGSQTKNISSHQDTTETSLVGKKYVLPAESRCWQDQCCTNIVQWNKITPQISEQTYFFLLHKICYSWPYRRH